MSTLTSTPAPRSSQHVTFLAGLFLAAFFLGDFLAALGLATWAGEAFAGLGAAFAGEAALGAAFAGEAALGAAALAGDLQELEYEN